MLVPSDEMERILRRLGLMLNRDGPPKNYYTNNTNSFSLPDPGVLLYNDGESQTLNFRVSWMGVAGGAAAMLFYRSNDTIISTVSLRTVGLADMAYPVSGVIYSRARADDYRTLYYEEDITEDGYRRHFILEFDYTNMTVRYQKIHQQKDYSFPISMAALDLISALHYVRALKTVPSKPLLLPIYYSRKLYTGSVQYLGREEIRSVNGRTRAIAVRPVLPFAAFFETETPMTVFVSDDGKRTPLRMTTRLFLGSIRAELVEDIF